MKSIVIVGYGQLGAEICKQHLLASNQVYSICRSQLQTSSPLHQPFISDLDTLSEPLSLPNTIECLYYLAPPSNSDLTDKRLKQFLALHKSINIRHIVYISTSGVYGDSKGEWITEQTPPNPAADRAKRRLDAEQQLIAFNQQYSTAITILRCSAIYSSKTVNNKRILANTKPVIKSSLAPFTNRIHLDDLTQVCLSAMKQPPQTYEIYNVSDGQPSTTTAHAWLLSDLAGIERNKEINLEEADQYYSPAYMSYLNESKRLDISKLKQQLKPALKFENCRDGIKQCLKYKLSN